METNAYEITPEYLERDTKCKWFSVNLHVKYPQTTSSFQTFLTQLSFPPDIVSFPPCIDTCQKENVSVSEMEAAFFCGTIWKQSPRPGLFPSSASRTVCSREIPRGPDQEGILYLYFNHECSSFIYFIDKLKKEKLEILILICSMLL